MAKLRRNHGSGRGRGSDFGASLWRLFVLLILLCGAIAWLFTSGLGAPDEHVAAGFDESPGSEAAARTYLPTGPSDQVVHHAYYSLGYDEDWEQPRWVAYRLTPKQVKNRRVKRRDDFRPDPQVRTGSAERDDYRRSGYSRGHLVPAGDMAFDERAMNETFYYSNMSPQLAAHNGAVWRELEESVRDWVRERGATYIVTGPIVGERPETIGRNAVAVPEAFYKVLLREDGEGIGFVIPHARQSDPLEAFAVSIDEVERQSGLDFFPELAGLATAEAEAGFDVNQWPSDERRYQRRVNSWNKQR